MTQKSKRFWLIFLCLLGISLSFNVRAAVTTAIDRVLQQGYPAQSDELATLTEALKKEYEASHNVTALIFYSWGLLRQADARFAANDFIHASEYAKSGFFWLDEAVDLHQDNMRVRYLRARVDAWLPADSGRCVVTIKDTVRMLADKTVFTPAVRERISAMRYRALHNCNDTARANRLLAQIKKQNAALAQSLTKDFNVVPQWDSEEITQVLMPLVKGE
jgi:hypothetical protein